METAPRDGTVVQMLCQTHAGELLPFQWTVMSGIFRDLDNRWVAWRPAHPEWNAKEGEK